MSKPKSQADNRFSRQTLTLWALVLTGWIVSLGLFFSQPSLLGLTDELGQPVGRFVDLMQVFLFDQVAAGMVAHGRMEARIADRWPLLLGLSGWLLTAGWVGLPLLLRSSLNATASRLESGVLAILSGAAILSTTTLGVGLAGGLSSRWPLLLAFAVLIIGAGALTMAQLRRHPAPSDRDEPSRNRGSIDPNLPTSQLGVWLGRLVPVATVLIAVLMLLGCLMPPWEFDVVEYHLQAPKEFSQAGLIGFVSHNVYANMPLGAEMHSLAAMTLVGGSQGWWWGGLIGKSITGSFSLLAAALLGGYIARKYGAWSGWAAAALLLATPGNAHVAMAGLIDMVLAAYLLAAAVVTTLLWPQLRSGTAHWTDGLLLGLLAGGAAACKYTGLLFVVFPIAAAVSLALVKSGRKPFSMRIVAAGFVGLVLTCFPWYAKNLWWTGNPFFPLATNLFGPSGLSARQIAQWQHAHQVPSVVGGSRYGLMAMWEAGLQVLLRSNFLPPTIVFLAICGVAVVWLKPIGMKAKWCRGWLYLLVWVGLVWWLGTHRIDRFWLPALPLACGLAALGATWIARRLSLSLASIMVLLSLIYGGFIIASGAIGDNRFFVALSALRGDSGSDELPGRLTPIVGWANETFVRPDERLLLIGEAKAYDFHRPVVYSTCFDRSPAEIWLLNEEPEQQRENLARAGVTHVLINWSELARYRSPGNYGFSEWPQRDDIKRLVSDQVLRPLASPFDAQNAEVFEVVQSND
ncbi:MAG: hypothetical protein ABI557_06180 [Aureliella sp.]